LAGLKSLLKSDQPPADNQSVDHMKEQRVPAPSSATVPVAGDADVRYVARQPILDLHGHVHGYELLFRCDSDSVFCANATMATRTILDDTVLFGLERYTNGLPAFIQCSAETLTERFVQVLPPGMTVLLIPADAQPTPELIEALLELRALGYRLALNDFTRNSNSKPLLECADYICADFSLVSAENLPWLREQLSDVSAPKVARKIDTHEEYDQACFAGFTLFHGNYLCHPSLVKNRKVPTNRFLNFELLRHLNREPVDLKQVSELVLRDPSLTYRLLRLVNSPFCAVRQEVRSIESALLIVGEQTFRRVATLAILSELNTGRPAEILQIALVRARFCSLAADFCALDPAEQYLLGMLSLLPAMLGLPMEALTPSLPLRSEIRDALEGVSNPERSLLAWLQHHERGEWVACDAIAQADHFSPEHALKCYPEALAWARDTLAATS
jgi:EAL and modified HD-GYP domain-containing signal transduction protein